MPTRLAVRHGENREVRARKNDGSREFAVEIPRCVNAVPMPNDFAVLCRVVIAVTVLPINAGQLVFFNHPCS